MYTSLFEHHFHDRDGELIANIIDDAIMQQNFKLDMIVHFMKNGCFAMLYLGKTHNASWNICWCSDNPNTIDTGIGSLSILNPNFNDTLVNHIIKITMIMTAFCECDHCRQQKVEDFGPFHGT